MTITIIGMLRLKGRAYFNNLYLSQVSRVRLLLRVRHLDAALWMLILYRG